MACSLRSLYGKTLLPSAIYHRASHTLRAMGYFLPQLRCCCYINCHRFSVDNDAIVTAGTVERDIAVTHIIHHFLRISFQRITPTTTRPYVRQTPRLHWSLLSTFFQCADSLLRLSSNRHRR